MFCFALFFRNLDIVFEVVESCRGHSRGYWNEYSQMGSGPRLQLLSHLGQC